MNNIRKMQTAAGGPIHYSRTMTTDNLSKAANYVGEYVLKGLGAFGKIMAAPFVQLGPTSATIYKSKKLLAKEKAIELKSEELLGKAMTWVSPLNYGAALVTGNGLNARKGEEEVASWSPAALALGRVIELYAGPKGARGVIKGTKAGIEAAVNMAAKAGSKSAKKAVVARKINKVVNETNDLSKLLAFDLFQELTSAPTSKITRLRPEFSLAMQDKNYMFGKLLWSTNLTKDRYATSLTKHIKVMDTKLADPQVYVTQALYPLAIKNGGLRAAHGGLTRPIWLNSNKPYFGTPTGVSNSTNYTYIIDANKFTPELNLLRNIGGTHYEYPGTAQLPIEGTKRILWDPVLLQYTSTIFTEAPKSEISSTASLKFFERRPSRISEAEKLGVPKGERNVKQGYLLKDAIEEANKFAEKWGYDKLSQNATLLDIENLYNQHNTFFRGVTTEQLENTRNRIAKELGINPELLTNDLYLLYVSTHPWPGNDRIWVTPFSHYGKIYGNADMIGGKGLLSAVMRPWKTTKDIKLWPKLSLWTLGFKEDVSNPVITPWVSNAPDAIRSLGALSEFLVKSPLIYRGLGKDFKGTFLLYLKYKDGQGKLGWIESLVGELPLEIIIEKQPKINLTKTDEVVQEYVNNKSITGPPVVSDGNSRMIWRKNRWSKEGTGIMNAKFRPDEPTNPHHISLSPDFNMESIPEKTYFWGTTPLPFKGVLGKGLGLDISTALAPNLLYNAFRSLHWMEPKVQELGLLYLETGNLKPIILYYKQASPIEKGQLSSIVRQPMFLNSDIPYRFYNDYKVVMKENPILQKEINNMTPLDRTMFKHSLGWASTTDNGLPVIFSKEPGFSGTKVIGHEGNHAFLYRFEQPLNMQALLERALPAEETKIVNGKEVRLTGNDKKGLGSAHINKERGSTIHDARSFIINSYYKQNGKYPSYTLLNLLIDRMTEEQLRLAIRTTSAYGREYAPLIKDFEALRECLKYAYKIGGKINIQV